MAVPARESAAVSSTSAGQPAPPARAPTDRVAAVLALQRSAGNAATVAAIQRMAACPTNLQASDPTLTGWKPYFGNSAGSRARRPAGSTARRSPRGRGSARASIAAASPVSASPTEISISSLRPEAKAAS